MHKSWLPASLMPLVWFVVWLVVAVLLLVNAESTPVIGRSAKTSTAAAAKPQHSSSGWVLEAQGLVPQPPLTPAAHASNLVALPNNPQFSLVASTTSLDRSGLGGRSLVCGSISWQRHFAYRQPGRVVRSRTAFALVCGRHRFGRLGRFQSAACASAKFRHPSCTSQV